MRRATLIGSLKLWVLPAILLAGAPAAAPADAAAPAVDYLAAARRFADCMIRWGRDRYGPEPSPLFAVLLVRGKEPHIGPQPVFDAPAKYKWQKQITETPFRKFNYNRCLNYPPGLGAEGPHKVTLTGCDPYEDADLYAMLFHLSRATGQPRYRDEAQKALRWWFTHTQSPATGLYPWGEHLGWDFEHECPTYFEGPSKHLYAACYHEIKDRVPFLDLLASIPAAEPGGPTPLERYALGVWNAHYWDKTKAVYCRHGDYTGRDDRRGSLEGYPAHQGAHLRLWAAAYLVTDRAEVRREMAAILNKVLDVQIARARQYGFIPATFKPDLQGARPRRWPQSDRLGRHAAEVSVALREAAPEIAAKVQTLARLLLGEEKVTAIIDAEESAAGLRIRREGPTGGLATLAWPGSARRAAGSPDRRPAAEAVPPDRPDPAVADLAKADAPNRHADAILRHLDAYRATGDEAYLRAAETQARRAWVRFMDGTSPLPKAFDPPRATTAAGNPFPSFYFRGARLMHAFARLGEALAETDR